MIPVRQDDDTECGARSLPAHRRNGGKRRAL
jgi:hypothetical protein